MIDLAHLAVAIDTQRDGAVVWIRPRIDNPEPLTLRYRLTVNQQGPAGSSNISQGGDISTGATPSSVRLSLPAGAQCNVHLEVFQGEQLLKQVDAPCAG